MLARFPVCGRTTSPGSRSRRRSSGRASPRPRSTTSTSAARTRRARTTGMSRAWRSCSRGFPSRLRGSPSIACAPRGCRRLPRPPTRSWLAMPTWSSREASSRCRARRSSWRSRTRPFPGATARSGTRRSAGASRTRGTRRCSRSSRWARRARTSPSGGASRGRIRTRSRFALSSGGPPRRKQVASPTSSSRSATSPSTSIRGRTRARRLSPASGRCSARAGR